MVQRRTKMKNKIIDYVMFIIVYILIANYLTTQSADIHLYYMCGCFLGIGFGRLRADG